MKICIILGTRPEIIKMCSVIRYCRKRKLDYFILHTGQHYSYEMDAVLFKELELPKPKYNLNIGSGNHGEQTGKIIIGIENVLSREKPDVVLVQGDTNTVLAGALAATKLHIKVGHVEAGLRSYDKNMPEEINRVLVDHISNNLFPPTCVAKQNLLAEGISRDKIVVTGNTIVDAISQNLKFAKKKACILKKMDIVPQEYFLATIHRQENVDDVERLKEILGGLELVCSKLSTPVIFPMHPRTKKVINDFGLETHNITKIGPLSFLEFLYLEANAKLVLTDSGGVQEETCILRVPCVTLRDNTERPETIKVKSNTLAGKNSTDILHNVELMINNENMWDNPYGDGKSGKRIVKTLENWYC